MDYFCSFSISAGELLKFQCVKHESLYFIPEGGEKTEGGRGNITSILSVCTSEASFTEFEAGNTLY